MVNKDEWPQPRPRFYLIALLLTILAVIATYLIELSQGKADPFNRVVLPLLALLFKSLSDRALAACTQPALGRGRLLRHCGACLF